jgi:hypothetical protein
MSSFPFSTRPANLSLALTTLVLVGVQYKLRSISLCTALQPATETQKSEV